MDPRLESLVLTAVPQLAKKAPLYLEAIKIATQVLGKNHPDSQTIMENYKTMLSQLRQAELR